MKKTIAIVDDHILIAKALSGIIENFANFQVLFEVENGQQLIQKLSNKKNIPDIVLVDVNMPIMNGFETADWLSENMPQIQILALSMQNDELSLINMIKAGANGYLLKNAHPNELEKALNILATTGNYYPDWVANKLISSLTKDKKNLQHNIKLSDREVAFLKYCSTELTYKEIADKMFCSPRTVEGYRDSLFEKLDVKSRVGLAVFAIKNGFSEI